MNSKFFYILIVLVVFISSSVNVLSQQRERIVGEKPPIPENNRTQSKSETVSVSSTPKVSTQKTSSPQTLSNEKQKTSFAQHLAKIKEAKKLFTSRPIPTSDTTSIPSIELVTIAALEPSTSKIHLITLPKKLFLTRNAEVKMTSSEDELVSIRIVRANGVNTAVTIFTEDGKSLTPLIVQYPIERNGKYSEMAYYISIHPALRTPDAVSAGKAYLRTTIDLGVRQLKEKGVTISPEIIAMAERLCIVEHADHQRFRTESRKDLFDEIYMLLAFNEGNTYRYAVSFAGAGGLIQMIPATYRMVRTAHPKVRLMEDFVDGMRNHENAIQAMLLYMQDTWNDLASREDVINALENKLATQSELMAAGYNSNPARLPLYIRRGGADWRTLIPRETQIYLDIYKSHESLVPLPRTVVQKPQNASR